MLGGEGLLADNFHQAKVKEADRAVGAEHVVAWVRITGAEALLVQQLKEEAVDDFAVTIPLSLGQLLDLLKPDSLNKIGDEHPAGRELGMNPWHADEWMPPESALNPALVLGFDLIVELLADPLA